jgi:hypothetical protein
MCADPRSSIWRRRNADHRLSDDADLGASASADDAGQDVPMDADEDCECGLPNLTDCNQMET